MRTLKISLLIFNLSITLLAQWHWQNPLPQGNHIFTIQFVNENIGWMAGDLGKLLTTTDGGENWETQNFQSIVSTINFNEINNGSLICVLG